MSANKYRHFATECLRLANSSSIDNRRVLVHIADVFFRLAEESKQTPIQQQQQQQHSGPVQQQQQQPGPVQQQQQQQRPGPERDDAQ